MVISTRALSVVSILLSLSVATCSDHCPYHISPSCPIPVELRMNNFTSCHTTSHCSTLSNIVKNPDRFLATNQTLIFIPGNHILAGQPLSVANLSDITLGGYSHGNQNSRITCRDSFLSFSGVSNLLVTSLDFVGCRVELFSTTATFKHTSFTGSCADNGGAVAAYGGSIITFEHNTFIGNTATVAGGAVFSHGCSLSFLGNTSFKNNQAVQDGGAVYFGALDMDHYNNISFQGWNKFTNNSGSRGGAIFVQINSHLSLKGQNEFSDNTGAWGGAITGSQCSTVTITGNTTLKNNSARLGAGLCILQQSYLYILGNVTVYKNDATYFGAGIAVRDSTAQLDGCVKFASNKAKTGGGIYIENGHVILKGAGAFSENSATTAGHSGFGGAVHASSSTVEFEGTDWVIVNNVADYGGGIALTGIEGRTLYLSTNTTILFQTNVGRNRGGALFVENNPYIYCEFEGNNQSLETCFFQHVTKDCYAVFPQPEHDTVVDNLHLVFVNNTAGQVGNVLHGGSLESCGYCNRFHDAFFASGLEAFKRIANITSSPDRAKDISSEPFKVCACNNSQPICDQKSTILKVFPQQTVSWSVAALGQMHTIVPAVLRAVVSDVIQLNESQILQSVGTECTDLQYTLTKVNSSNKGTISMYADEPCSVSGFPLTVEVEFLPCPTGFSTTDSGLCDCEERLAKYIPECNVYDSSFLRPNGSNYWMGSVSNTSEIILNPHCPFDFCTERETRFTLNSTDLQCAHHRSGVLCGACQSGFSLALGSSRCLSCSNVFLALLIPFALAGIALVTLLFALQLTVSSGTISGLVFYANILTINRRIFFPSGETNILTVFIAWINLDLGIETCFFDGLDTYVRTWLQFVFPVYIWLLVGLVALLATVSDRIARAIGDTNPISVLATLFLLSFTKFIRTTCSVAFSYTTLEYPGDKSHIVWLYDGNIGYLDTQDGKHLVLFIFSILAFVFVFLPYSLLLLFGQWSQKKLHLKCISPRNSLRLKSFLDAYYAPYKAAHRYWVGLLLLVRPMNLFTSAFIAIYRPEDPHAILMVMLVFMVLLTWPIGHGIYKKWYLNILEGSFVLNLLIVIGGTYQIALSGGSQAALIYTSVSVAFVTFAGIVIFSLCQRKFVKKCWHSICHRFSPQERSDSFVVSSNSSQMEETDALCIQNPHTTCTVIDITENRYNFKARAVSLREPMLEMATY